jgi:hypothetical protein
MNWYELLNATINTMFISLYITTQHNRSILIYLLKSDYLLCGKYFLGFALFSLLGIKKWQILSYLIFNEPLGTSAMYLC